MRAELQDIMRRVSMSPLIDGGEEEAAIRQVLASACEGVPSSRSWRPSQDQTFRSRVVITEAPSTANRVPKVGQGAPVRSMAGPSGS